MMRILIKISLLFLVSGCASSGSAIGERLDDQTGATVSTSSKPIVFFKDSSARAAHARDYVYLGPVKVNRMGEYRFYLWLGIWSTSPLSDPSAQRDGFESVTLFADGEPLSLALAGWSADDIGASGNVYMKPVASAADAFYEVTIDQIRLIGNAASLRMLTAGASPFSYETWNDQDDSLASLRIFVEQNGY